MMMIGLTGSIGMGKSTVAKQCALLGAKIICADAIVHALMQPSGKAFAAIAKQFPEAVVNGAIDRKLLGKIVFGNNDKIKQLESILHPLVKQEEEQFVAMQQLLGAKIVVLDIPLLFEAGSDERVDMTLVASAPYFIQRQRVLARPNMTEEKFAAILTKQMPDIVKRRRADFVIATGLGKAQSMQQLKLLFKTLGVL